ncbi:MAG: phenylalanine--tRNA ligase subunit beta [Chitinophagaceae bacterium]|nr:phenylalanine--tRNA ligase subunit beta [Chitinophagaceae bacterium]
MTISYNWLCDYLPLKPSPEELSGILTSVGLEVEELETREFVKGGLKGLVIGKVMECVPHPNADKLRLTKVDIGTGELLQIVCGAPNVAAGQTVVVAPVGVTVHPLKGEPFEIKKAKIRGEESQGMICAEDEISLGESHDGIMVLEDSIPLGTPANTYFNIPAAEMIYEIGLTPNRMDAMSHLGVVKDVCAYFSHHQGETFVSRVPSVTLPQAVEQTNININIEDAGRCARYAGICIKNIQVKDSPDWLQQKLISIGLRPINNIVDITNFVLHECGQPLHAFDLLKISGQTINIKTVEDQTLFKALDGSEKKLSQEDLMICNAEEPMCIAGVYGGAESGVTGDTTSIFLESAWFAPDSIRKTSMRHHLRTDAAIRFEKGTDISQVIYGLTRAAQLICDIAGGQVASQVYDVYPVPFDAKIIQVNFDRVRQLAGKHYSASQIKGILTNLCFAIEKETETEIWVKVPFAKTDISYLADVVEEIMRIDGLDQIPFTGKISYSMPQQSGYQQDIKSIIADKLTGKGCYEIFTNSITNSSYYEDQDRLVKMMNSLSANLDTMRPSMLESGLETIAYNLNRKNHHLQYFEFGKVYEKKADGFLETEMLSMYFTGSYRADHWTEKSRNVDAYFVKGILEGLLSRMNIQFRDSVSGLDILFQNKPIGRLFSVDESKRRTFDIKQEVWYAELQWKTIENFYRNTQAKYKPVAKFQMVNRDLALILDRKTQYADVQAAVKQTKSKLLHSLDLFDVFESEKLGVDKKSYAINLSFYNDEHTLTDAEVEAEMKNIIHGLEQKLGAVIRGN